jgi:hypothetical protein
MSSTIVVHSKAAEQPATATQESAPAPATAPANAATEQPVPPEVLVLRLRRTDARLRRLAKQQAGQLNVEWDESVVDNEHLNRKKSKSTSYGIYYVLFFAPLLSSSRFPPSFRCPRVECCIFHKKLDFGESDDESEWESENLGRPRRNRHAQQQQRALAGGPTVAEGGNCCGGPPTKGVFPRNVHFGDEEEEEEEEEDGDDGAEKDPEGGHGHDHDHSRGHGHGHGDGACGHT